MPSNLAGGVCLAEHSVCLLRGARLNPDCTVMGGECSGFVTTAITTLTATPEYQDDFTLEPENGCGDIIYTVFKPGGLRRINLTGDIGLQDPEVKFQLFGGSLILGRVGGPFPGEVIGWNAPNYTDPPPAANYLEVIVKNEIPGAGECVDPDNPSAAYTGYIFGKVRLTIGDRTFENDHAPLSFQGAAEANPNLGLGPWGDFPGAGVIASTPLATVGYSQEEWDDIAALAACGCQDLEAVYSG